MSASEELQSCEECGATIYPEHLQKHAADKWQGKLLCPHCLHEKQDEGPVNPAELLSKSVELSPEPDNPAISLASGDEADVAPAASVHKATIKTFGGGGITMDQARSDEIKFRRPTLTSVPQATRCRTFHAKLNEASIAYLDRMINEWADGHDDIEIKFATSTVGVFEGKHSDPNLIVTVFY